MRMSSKQNGESLDHVRWRKQAHGKPEHMPIHMYIVMTAAIFLVSMPMLLSNIQFKL